MSAVNQNHCACPTPEIVATPGSPGISVFTYTTADFIIPPIGSGIIVNLQTNDQFVVGNTVVIGNAAVAPFGTFSVAQIGTNGDTTLIYASGTQAGTTVPAGTKVTTSGISGQSAFTRTTGSFTILAPGTGTTLNVADNTWMGVGQPILITDNAGNFATFEVNVIVGGSSTQVSVKWLGYSTDTWAQGASIPIGSIVVCSGRSQPIGTLPSIITDSSGGASSAAIAVGVGESFITFSLPALTSAAGYGTTGGTVIDTYIPGFAFSILQMDFISTASNGAGASAQQVFQAQINGANITGGVVTLPLTGTQATGRVTAGTAVTAANTGTAGQAIKIVYNTGGVVFTAGSGILILRIKNLDTANAFASLTSAVNQITNAL